MFEHEHRWICQISIEYALPATGDGNWNVIHGYSYHSYNKAGPRMLGEVATLREKLTVRGGYCG